MSSQFHIVLRNCPDVVTDWWDDEVVRRWWKLCPGRRNKDKSAAEPTDPELRILKGDPDKLAENRKRLSSVSRFIRFF